MSRLTSEPFRRKLDDSSENYKVRRYGREEWETLAQNAINKLGRLEDIEEELGCPLEVVFKALKDGIIDFENNEHRYIHLRNNGKYVLPSNCWIFHTFHFSYVFKLSDYQKTWWLKGEKEKCTILN